MIYHIITKLFFFKYKINYKNKKLLQLMKQKSIEKLLSVQNK